MVRRWRYLVGAALLGLTTALGAAPGTALADAALRSTSPEDGAVQAQVPKVVTFTFNEELQDRFTTVMVTGSAGRTVKADKAGT